MNVNDRPQALVADILARTKYRPWLADAPLRSLYLVLIPSCLLVCATNGFDGSMINGLQAVTSWKKSFNNPHGSILGFMAAAYPLGAICSTPFSGIIADRFGRRWSILIGSCIMIVGVILQTVSNTIAFFIGARIVIGFGITLALAPAPVLISELAHPKDRVIFTAMYNTSFYLGAVAAAWITFGSFRINNSWGWRLPSVLQAVPAIFQIIFIMLLPESPRWLIYKDRPEEALAILARHHGGGDPNDELVQAEYYEICETLRLEKEAKDVGLKLLVATPGNRKRLAILVTLGFFGQWSGVGLVSYYLAKILTSIGITAQKTQTLINGCLTTCNYATGIMAAFMTTKFGRRSMFIGGAAGMWLTFSALTISIAVYNEKHGTDHPAGRSALAFIFIYYTTYNICLNPLLYLYPSEVLPYRLRAMGMSVLVFSNKCALFFNQFVNPIGLDNIGWHYYLVYVGWLLVELAVFYFLYPETKGYSLESVAEIFDGPGSTALTSEKTDPYYVQQVEAADVKRDQKNVDALP